MQRHGGSRQPAKGRRTLEPEARKAVKPTSADHSPEQFDQLKRERNEALEQLAATSDVLKVISNSPGELRPAFEAMLANAVRICEAKFGTLYRTEGDSVRCVAMHGVPKAFAEERRRVPVIRPAPTTTLARALATKRPVQIADVREYPNTPSGYTSGALARLAGARTLLTVPMLKESELIGAIVIYRTEVRPFSDKQIELVKNFAAQAVIAIENTRLLSELRQSLEQQTATSEVLKVISSSTGELEPVFNAMLANATRICEAKFGTLFRFDGKAFHRAAGIGVPSALAELQKKRGPYLPESGTLLDRVLQTGKVAHSPDYAAEPIPGNAAKLGGARSTVAVPMLKDNELVGAIIIYRQEVKPFTDKQIELVTTFADQAVIAIENARLLSELRESLQQQTATADVLKAISRSAFDLKTVLDALVEAAARLCEADQAGIARERDGVFERVGEFGMSDAYMKYIRTQPVIPERGTAMGRALLEGKVVHIPDVQADPYYTLGGQKLGGIRTILTVPMLRDGTTIGVLGVTRHEVRPFTDKQIDLVSTFADQAAIAIENVRLFESVEARTRELSEALEQQTATSEVLKVISRSTFDLQAVLQTLVESAARLCDADKTIITREKNGIFYRAEAYGFPREFIDHVRDTPIKPERGSGVGRALLERRVIHIPDVTADPEFTFIEHQNLGDFRTLLAVPMLREGVPSGVVTLTRTEARPFTDKQIELATTFADQAAIAIENVRLLNDLNKLNQQLEQRVADQVGEIERMGRLRRFLPPQVADLIVASGTEKELESHRREITALFCDLRGFTGFSESSDPEDVMALLREYHAAIGGIINKYRGTLERYAGDGVMVVFNDPIPVDNPALQAVLMAIDMRAAIAELIERWRKLGHDIGFGIGIAHGFATLGTIGFEGRFDYAAIGTVSNVASRLCDEAKPGQILISPRVLMAVEKDIAIEPVGDFALKGIRRPLTAYNVLATRAEN